MEENIKKIIKILLTILIIVVAIKFFIYALPFIIVLLIGYLVYKKVKENNGVDISKTSNNTKKGKVLEGEVVKEQVDN